ncbi:MAG: DUF2971 domain-containing protein, partial [Janthinobacterium lividum]
RKRVVILALRHCFTGQTGLFGVGTSKVGLPRFYAPSFSRVEYYMTYGIMQRIIAKSHLLAFLKDPAFEEEKEWRMVASESTMGSTANYLRYRSSRNMFISYLDLPVPARPDYNQSYNNLIIDEVRVSPTPHQDLALASCRMMMEHHQCKSVQSSAIPYRNW